MDSRSELLTEQFNSGDLVKCYALPNLREVMPGNMVMLRSGGPRMTVYDTRQGDDGETVVLVQYQDDAHKIIKGEFYLTCLTCYGAR